MKIPKKFYQSASRYLSKNTVRAKYNRSMDAATVSGVAMCTELCRIPHWNTFDMCITPMLGILCYGNIGKAFKHLFDLQPIRNRAIQIKKATKAAQKLNKKV